MSDTPLPSPEGPVKSLTKKQRRTARSWALVRKVADTFPLLWPRAAVHRFRPMKTGTDADVRAWIAAHPDGGLSTAEWRKAVQFLVSRTEYLCTLTPGAARFDICGEPAGTVTPSEALHAARKMAVLKARLAKPRSPVTGGNAREAAP